MKDRSDYYDGDFKLVEYDDNNLKHVLSGSQYGQPWSSGWTEDSTFEKKYKDRFTNKHIAIDLFLLLPKKHK